MAPPVRFLAVFAACFCLSFGLLLTPPIQVADGHFSRALVKASHELVTLCGGRAILQGAILRDPRGGFGVEMKDGCNAVNVTFLLWSAVLAYPAGWKARFWGLATGTFIIQTLNIGRFISLFYIGQYSMPFFEFAHGYLWETLLILDAMVFFWLWADRVSRSKVIANAGR